MEFAMKSTYQRRTGHERTKFAKKNNNYAATRRRERALVRLEEDRDTTLKLKESATTDETKYICQSRIDRINKEITILKTRI